MPDFSSTTVAGLIVGLWFLYALSLFIRDFRRRDIQIDIRNWPEVIQIRGIAGVFEVQVRNRSEFNIE